MLKDTDTVSTTVVGGRDDTDGLCDAVIDVVEDGVDVSEELTLGLSEDVSV